MYKFGKKSKEKMSGIHGDLKLVLNEAIRVVDFSVLEGHRGEQTQNLYCAQGRSKVRFPDGKHNSIPSDAVDVAPCPYPRTEAGTRQAYYMAGIIRGVAHKLGIKIRIGCDWNGDGEIRNDKFQDVWHIEKVG